MADKKTEKKTSYQVQAVLHIMTTVNIDAINIQDAIDQAKNMKEENFVTFAGEYLDGTCRITGVYESSPEGF